MSHPDGNNQETRRDSDLALIKDLIDAVESAVGDTLSGVLTENVRAQTKRACEELARMLADNGLDTQARMADELSAAFSSKESANAAGLVMLSESIFQISQAMEPPEEEVKSEAAAPETPTAEVEPARSQVPRDSGPKQGYEEQSPAEAPDRPVMYEPVDIPLSAIDPTDGKATAFPEIKAAEPELRPISIQAREETEQRQASEAPIRDEPNATEAPDEPKEEPSPEAEETADTDLERRDADEPEQEHAHPEHFTPAPPVDRASTEDNLDAAIGPEQIEWIEESVAPEMPQSPQAEAEEPIELPRERDAEEEPSFVETYDHPPKREQASPALPKIINLPVVDFASKPAARPARPDLVVYAFTSDAAFVSRLRSVSGPDTEVRALRSQAVAAKALAEDETALLIVDIGDSPDQSGPFNAQLVSQCLDRVIVVGSNFTLGEIKALKKIGVRAVVEKSATPHGLTRDAPGYEMDIGA